MRRALTVALLPLLILTPATVGCLGLTDGAGALSVTVQSATVPYGDIVVAFAENTGDAALTGPVTLQVINTTADRSVRTVQLMNGTPQTLEPGERVGLVWDGRTAGGDVAPWGPYRLVARAGDARGEATVTVEKPLVRHLRVEAAERNATWGDDVTLTLQNRGDVGFQGRVSVVILNNSRWERVDAWNLTGVTIEPGAERDFTWDGRARSGEPAPPGRYMARVVFVDGGGERADLPSTDWFNLRRK